MEVRLLGPVDVVADDGSVVAVPGQKLQLLLAALASERGRVVSAERLVDILYGDDPPRQPTNSLQVLVSRLRRSLSTVSDGAPPVRTTDAGYALADGEQVRSDVEAFERLVTDARTWLADEPGRAASGLNDALGLVRGEPLAGLPSDGWARAERARLAEARLAALEDRIDADLASGRHALVVAELEQLTAEHPLRERLRGQLVLALYRCGRQADALRAFREARDHLVEELGIEPSAELRRLESAVLAQDPALDLPAAPSPRGGGAALGTPATPAPPPAVPRSPDHTAPSPADGTRGARGNVPRPLTPLLGRTGELADLLELIDSHRLVTVVGPGGAGKTRLSIEAALALAPGAPDGVWLVDLASVRDGTGVLGALVRTLRLDEGALAGAPVPRTVDELAAVLSDRRIVLVVDNCEQVVDDVALLVESLLGQCPDLRILATSRETLGVPGEFLFVVPPLPLDDAMELFFARVDAGGGPQVSATDTTTRAVVAEICRRLDGLPLAVELAAARARHLDLAEIASRLDQRFDLLVEAPRTAQPRQRTLRAVVDWSYGLLDDEEQRVFERLAVFSGGASLAAARSVCADSDVTAAEVEAALGRLADKSLVAIDRTPTGVRYTMLQTLTDYAATKLAERGEHATVARRHARWAADLTSRASITRPESGHVAQVRILQLESANVQEAVAWALTNDPRLALEMANDVGWHWFTTMQAGLAWSVLTLALARVGALAGGDEAPAALVAQVQALAGVAGVLAGHRDEAFALAEAAQEAEPHIDDPRRLAWQRYLRAAQHSFVTDTEGAEHWLELARVGFEASGDEHGLSACDYQRGVLAGLQGDLPEARRLLTRACATTRRLGNHMTLMAALARLGEVAEREGRWDDAQAAWHELGGLAAESAVPALMALASAGLAFEAFERGDAEAATRHGEAALAASKEGVTPKIGGYAMLAWGVTQAAFADRRLGVERVHEAAGLFSRIGYHGGAAECWWRLSRLNADGGDGDEAVACAERAVECAGEGQDAHARIVAKAQLDAARRQAS
jgi:predicted ATPase/DNA-binding SARP family transcriptional activator